MKIKFIIPIVLVLMFSIGLASATVVNYTVSGNWVAPTGVTSVFVEGWAGGGAGGGSSSNNQAGAGGAGGQYVNKTMTVIPGQSYAYTIGYAGAGASGAAGQAGGNTTFNSSLLFLAVGGAGGAANLGAAGVGSRTYGVGDNVREGGNGAAGVTSNGGGGGGGAGSTGPGNNASGTTGGATKADNGGVGGTGTSGVVGGAGTNYSAGGGGGEFGGGAKAGGAGAEGLLKLTYTAASTCTYGGTGNWVINCADACSFSSITSITGNNNVSTYGTGTLTFNSGGKWTFTGTAQYVKINSGCTFAIKSGGGFL